MGERKQTLDHRAELDRAGAIALLADLLAGLRSGAIDLQRGEQRINLRPNAAVAVSLTAKRKGKRESLELALEWRRAADELHIGAASTEDSERTLEREAIDAAPPREPLLLSRDALLLLGKDRLYALARTVELSGRSQLPKVALARVLSEHDLTAQLQLDDLRMMAAGLAVPEHEQLDRDGLLAALAAC